MAVVEIVSAWENAMNPWIQSPLRTAGIAACHTWSNLVTPRIHEEVWVVLEANHCQDIQYFTRALTSNGDLSILWGTPLSNYPVRKCKCWIVQWIGTRGLQMWQDIEYRSNFFIMMKYCSDAPTCCKPCLRSCFGFEEVSNLVQETGCGAMCHAWLSGHSIYAILWHFR